MAENTLTQESAHVTPYAFNPAEWLANYRAVGGECFIADGRMMFSVSLVGFSGSENEAACAMLRNIRDDKNQLAALRSFILENSENGISRPVTPLAFSPDDWCARFRDVGGWAEIRDTKPFFGWHVYGYSEEQNTRAREIWREAEFDDCKMDAIIAHLHDVAEQGAKVIEQ